MKDTVSIACFCYGTKFCRLHWQPADNQNSTQNNNQSKEVPWL